MNRPLGLMFKVGSTCGINVRRLREQGMTIVMTTNYLDEADQLCDRLAIIDGGRIRAVGSPKELKAGLGGDGVSLTIHDPDQTMVERFSTELKSLPLSDLFEPIPTGWMFESTLRKKLSLPFLKQRVGLGVD